MAISSLQELLVDELKDLYNAENQLVKALPKMAKAATNDDLQQAFEEHLEQTQEHVNRLEQIFERLGTKPTGKKCYAMQGLIEEGKEIISDVDQDSVLDAGIIGAAQKVEHYEIAGYGTARTHAKLLGEDQIAELLQQTLDEEGETNEKLTKLAESYVNEEAEKQSEEDA